MLFQINHPDGDSLCLLDIEDSELTMRPEFSDELKELATEVWETFDDSLDYDECLCDALDEMLKVTAIRVFVTEINI
jgi:hypothetical protein